MEFNFKSYDNSKQSISYCEVDKCKAVVELRQQLDQLKEENIKFTLDSKKLVAQYSAKLERLKATLAEIKEIAEKQIPYLNIDEAKTMIEVEYDYVGKIYNLEQRMYTILQKISECEI